MERSFVLSAATRMTKQPRSSRWSSSIEDAAPRVSGAGERYDIESVEGEMLGGRQIYDTAAVKGDSLGPGRDELHMV